MSTPPRTGGTRARRAEKGEPTTAKPVSSPSPSRSRSPKAPPAARRGEAERRRTLDPDALAALEEERDFLLRSLDDLEREYGAGDVDDDDYVELRDDYTARAAAVLRALEQRQVALASDTRPRRAWGRIVLGAAAVVLIGLIAGLLVARASGTRAPGQQLSGDTRQSTRDLLLQAQQLTGQANQQLSDGDTEAALGSFKSAIDTYRQVLAIQPNNAEALTYQAWVIHSLALKTDATTAAKLDDQAMGLLDEAVAAEPTYTDAHVFRAILYRNEGRTADALADLDAVDPAKVPPFMTQMVTNLRSELSGAGSATTATSAPAS